MTLNSNIDYVFWCARAATHVAVAKNFLKSKHIRVKFACVLSAFHRQTRRSGRCFALVVLSFVRKSLLQGYERYHLDRD
jgi:hypothetical protein